MFTWCVCGWCWHCLIPDWFGCVLGFVVLSLFNLGVVVLCCYLVFLVVWVRGWVCFLLFGVVYWIGLGGIVDLCEG